MTPAESLKYKLALSPEGLILSLIIVFPLMEKVKDWDKLMA